MPDRDILQTYDAIAYTDGGYRIDTGVGGWGVHLITGSDVLEFHGGEHHTDANRMELKAAVVALENLPHHSTKVAIYSDSTYVVSGVSSWLPTWRRDWKYSERVPLKNSDLWQEIRKMSFRHKITWCWVKSHSGNPGNQRADILATRGMEELLYGCVETVSDETFDVIAYTDGACKGNPGVGGWGVRFVCGRDTRDFYGGEKLTTNNRMELTAAIQALEVCPERPAAILVYTDSQYLMKGITEWMDNWKKKGWKTAKGEQVKNMDLWIALDKLCSTHNVSWRWVRGHNANPGNEAADILANRGITEILRC